MKHFLELELTFFSSSHSVLFGNVCGAIAFLVLSDSGTVCGVIAFLVLSGSFLRYSVPVDVGWCVNYRLNTCAKTWGLCPTFKLRCSRLSCGIRLAFISGTNNLWIFCALENQSLVRFTRAFHVFKRDPCPLETQYICLAQWTCMVLVIVN